MQVLRFWADYMRAEDLEPRTITERVKFIKRLERETRSITDISRQDLIHWTAGQNWSSKTRQHYKSTLHTFFTWMQDEGIRDDNPAARLPKVKHRRQAPNPFTVEEIQQLLNSGIYRNTRAMVALHYYLGLRVSEIAAVHGHDINRERRTLYTIGKGRKEAWMPIPAQLWPIVEQMPADSYWFPNQKANKLYGPGEGHILGHSVSSLLNAAIKRAGLKHRAHQLRAATATELNKAGVSAFVVQAGMRHENMATTTHYLLVDDEQIRAGLEQLPAVIVPERSGRARRAELQDAA